MIGMIVRDQSRIGLGDSIGEQLKPQLRRRVDQNPGAAAGLDERPYPGPLVVLIRRAAYRAVASDLRYAEACPRAKKSEFQLTRPAFVRTESR